eukprot:6195305-Pleurochrysis_carterae.AAC.1
MAPHVFHRSKLCTSANCANCAQVHTRERICVPARAAAKSRGERGREGQGGRNRKGGGGRGNDRKKERGGRRNDRKKEKKLSKREGKRERKSVCLFVCV